MKYFNNVFSTILGFERISSVPAYGGKALWFHQKDLHFCLEEEQMSFGAQCKLTIY